MANSTSQHLVYKANPGVPPLRSPQHRHHRVKTNLKRPPPSPSPSPHLQVSTASASDILRLVDSLHLPINSDIYSSLLHECTQCRSLRDGAEVHAHINRTFFEPGIRLANRLIVMYLACGCFDDALQVFDEMRTRDCLSWAAIILGSIESNRCEQAISFFIQMQEQGVVPNELILVGVFRACRSVRRCGFRLGRQVHGLSMKMGMTKDPFVASELVNLYGKNGFLENLYRLFNDALRRDIVLYTGMMACYNRESHFTEAIRTFSEMRKSGKRVNHFTFSSVLRACAGNIDSRTGMQVHAGAVKAGVDQNVFVGTSMINMYGKCGLLNEAHQVFAGMADKNAACWNAMLGAYLQREGCCCEALKLLHEMKAREAK
ncbi:Pentatricopeptide repeat-containing protein [Nymphaea thermarum]|nr:Pentatricopeptide repeat-containing protein [Nymphaea thermarum]